ncbi:MAG: glycoside hydrolase family 13 protein [Lachnospiraceae bacterium]|nr:glycoside hydrolase family 13 protein [Lachnospiraceae bacterium]
MEEQGKNMNRQALFADETLDYRIPEEPDAGEPVRLRFRTAREDVDRVSYIEEDKNIEAEMRKVSSDELFDYYEYELVADSEPQRYYFQVVKDGEICYFNRLGATMDIQSSYAFRLTPGFHTPEWVKGAVIYQIFVDRFCNGDAGNDVQECEYLYIGRPVHRVEDWSTNPSTMDVGCFYGGDLQGVWDKLDYLQYLGVEVIYFNPLFVAPSNHKYDSQDYDHIDPHYGVIVKDGGELIAPGALTNEKATRYQIRSADPVNLDASDAFFASFMEEAHRRGMKVIIDGVFNHCGSFNKWLDREKIYANQGGYEAGAFSSKDSPYRTFFKFYNEDAWPDNSNYDGWWGHDTLPKLNYEESPKLFEYILKIARKWVSPPFNVDGWRLDVAADLGHSADYNHKFWREFRNAVKSANPNAVILAEHYGDPSSWLEGDQWDTVMNYDAFMEPLTWFLTGMEKHSDEYNGALYGDGVSFFRSMYYHMSRMQTQSLMIAMNQLSNHDHSRFLTRTNQIVGRIGTAGANMANFGVNYGVFREAVMVQMTWPGAPTLYYGDETGVCGWTDPDNRRTYPWGHEDYELIEFHRYMIALHKQLPALRRGSLKQLLADRQLIAYGRSRGENKCVVIVNNRGDAREVTIPVWEMGICDADPLTRVMLTDGGGYNAGRIDYHAQQGVLTLTMPANSSILLSTGVLV